jgi:hypothetical protein
LLILLLGLSQFSGQNQNFGKLQPNISFIDKGKHMKHSLLVAALVAVALTACGKKEEAKPAAAPAPAPAPAAAPAQPAGMGGMSGMEGQKGMEGMGGMAGQQGMSGMGGMSGMEAKKEEPKK